MRVAEFLILGCRELFFAVVKGGAPIGGDTLCILADHGGCCVVVFLRWLGRGNNYGGEVLMIVGMRFGRRVGGRDATRGFKWLHVICTLWVGIFTFLNADAEFLRVHDIPDDYDLQYS